MRKSSSFFIIVILVLGSLLIVPQVLGGSSGASLKSWQYIGMVGQEQGYKHLEPEWKVFQAFEAPTTFTCKKVSIYAESAVQSSEENETKTRSWALVYVEVYRGSELLASGSVDVYGKDWYDVSLSNSVTLSPGVGYSIIAYSPYGKWNIYYHNDGHPNDQGAAAWDRGSGWEWLPIDFFVRYLAEFTISSSRLTELKVYVEKYEPSLQYTNEENYFPCDFYFDKNMDVNDNKDNYPSNWPEDWEEQREYLRYFVHVQEYAWDDDIAEPAIAIEYWYYYVADKSHHHDWEVFIIFLKETDPNQVLLLKGGQHGNLVEKFWNQVEKEGGTHTILFIGPKHAMNFKRYLLWPGDGQKIPYGYSYNKPIYVWDTDAIVNTSGYYDEIRNWDGDHVWWDNESKYWWRWYYLKKEKPGIIQGPWRKVPWTMPEEGTY
ncbi:hypothetical protein DRO56_02815 [Candidatus Bathyarchaeota archaeon]|nr:MAG: hypothetical protein DRO56_02815 [Candidatus Bathyarchaeota archaeon]